MEKYKCSAQKSIIKEDGDPRPNSVRISDTNVSIDRLIDKCINCGLCVQTCIKREGMKFDKNSELCVGCGQCIQTCPVNALIPDFDYDRFKEAKEKGKICICYTSPAVRVSIGDIFNKEYGSFELSKLIGLLRMIGFDYVFDTTFAADLTIMEEANELVHRIRNGGKLPMFTSCCPSWIKYAEQFYPEILDNISTCKSPIGMFGVIIKEYFAKKNNINKDDIYTVAITPCTAKKYEVNRDEIIGTDLVITINELETIIEKNNIKYDDIKESEYDSFFKEGSGSGVIFGNTGGVMEAALRTAYHIITGENLKEIEFNSVRGFDNVRETVVNIGNLKLNVCVIHEMSSAKQILEDVKNGTSKYHYIEIMNCLGGCIGGGGQPKALINKEKEIKEARIKSLYERDKNNPIRFSHENPQIKKLYEEFLGEPLSKKSCKLLHTEYKDKSNLIKETIKM